MNRESPAITHTPSQVSIEAASIAFVQKLKSLNPNADGWLRLSEADKMIVRQCMRAALVEVSKAPTAGHQASRSFS